MRTRLLLAATLVLSARLPAQAFPPPPVQRGTSHGTRVGLFGFGVRMGMDLNRGSQFVVGVALDVADLGSSRIRLRPSADFGIGNGANTYAGSLEILFRMTDDNRAVTPYLGGGAGVAGHAGCGADAGCPAVWVNAVLGVEVRYRSTFNWLLEYHPMDVFQHNRLYFGLTTRRGN